jgi:hypothetical protein
LGCGAFVCAAFGGAASGCTTGRVGHLDQEGVDSGGFDAAARDGGVADADAIPDAATDGGVMLPDGARPPLFEVSCDDGIDQDGDGLPDCADIEDCTSAPCDTAGNFCSGGTCGGCRGEATETACGDGADEDCDGMLDCADPDCDGVVCGPGGVVCGGGVCPCTSGFEERSCGDGIDDDCDGMIDCADPSCMGRVCGGNGLVCIPSTSACMCPGGMELCQGIDDDCSGTADEGCPGSLGSCCAAPGGTFGGPGGTAWVDACPTGAALIGVAGRAPSRLDQLQPICAALVFEETMMFPESTFRVRTGAAIYGSPHGATGTADFEDRCPMDQVVVGLAGHSDDFVDQISLQCASISIARGGGFSWSLRVTRTSVTPSRGGTTVTGAPFDVDCSADSVVSGLNGRAGTRLNQLSFDCRRLQLNLR